MRKVKMIARLTAGVCLAGLSLPGIAQDAPGTIPGLGNYSLPSSQPTPTPTPTPGPPPLVPPVSVTPSITPRAAPTPAPTPTARATPSAPAIVLPTLRPAAPPTPRAGAPRPAPVTPAAIPNPAEALPTEPATAPSAIAPTPADTPVAASTVTPTPSAEGGLPAWLIPVALVGLAVLIGGVIALRRRRAASQWEEPVAYVAPEPEPEPLPPATLEPQAPAAAPAPRFLTPPPPPAPVVLPSSLTIDAPSVRRAGINLITATADVSVVLRNESAEPVRNIRVEIRLTSAQPGQDAALAALFAGPIERLFTPAFDLAAGEEKTVRTLSTMARDSITVLQAGERPMFVPVVAVRAIDSGADGERQAMAAFALGVERAGSDKLGPFWLDQPPRMYDNIGVRPHAVRG